MSRQRPDQEPSRGRWPEPKEPPPGARAAIPAMIGVVATGIAVYGAATTDPDADAFLLFLGAAVVGLAVFVVPLIGLLARTPWMDLPQLLTDDVVADALRLSRRALYDAAPAPLDGRVVEEVL